MTNYEDLSEEHKALITKEQYEQLVENMKNVEIDKETGLPIFKPQHQG